MVISFDVGLDYGRTEPSRLTVTAYTPDRLARTRSWRMGHQLVTASGRLQKGDLAMLGNSAFFVGVARDRKSRIGKCKDKATVANFETVQHCLGHSHLNGSIARTDR